MSRFIFMPYIFCHYLKFRWQEEVWQKNIYELLVISCACRTFSVIALLSRLFRQRLHRDGSQANIDTQQMLQLCMP